MSPHLVNDIVSVSVIGIVILALPTLVRRPRGWQGRLSLRLMNSRHSAVTDWGLSHVPIAPNDTILDVGCGGGRTIDKLATQASAGRVSGIDISTQSVAVSRRTNATWIEAGRVDIQQASVSKLPFTDGKFDLVTAVETHYYWPDPALDLREILRVLKPGGRLVLIAETYKGQSLGALVEPAMKLIGARYLTVDEHRDLLASAGFARIAIDVNRGKGWIAAVGTKP